MPQINCDNRQCPFNTTHPKFPHYTCIIDVLSLVDGKCEFWQAYKESQKIKWSEEENNVRMQS